MLLNLKSMGAQRTAKRSLKRIGLRCLVLGALAVFPAHAVAKTTDVDCTGDGDSGTGSALQTAIADASSGDTLVITGTCSEPEQSSDGETVFVVNKNLTLEAATGADAILQPSDNSGGSGHREGRVMEITNDAQVTLENLYFYYGNASESDPSSAGAAADGGGLYIAPGSSATALDDMFYADQAAAGASYTCQTADQALGYGGGVYNAGTLNLSNSFVMEDSTNGGCGQAGGGLFNASGATATISQTNFNDDVNNPSPSDGGAIYNDGTMTLTASNVTESGDEAVTRGGGIYNASGATITITNSTIAANEAESTCYAPGKTAGGFGGGIDNEGTMTLTFSTVSGNSTDGFQGNGTCATDPGTTGAGLYNGGSATVRGSIIAGNTEDTSNGVGPEVDPDCGTGGTIQSHGYNILGIGTGCGSRFDGTGDQVGTSGSPLNPELGPLGGGFNGQLDWYAYHTGDSLGGPPVGPAVDSNGDEQFTNGEERFTTFVMAPQTGSPALDAIPPGACDSFLSSGPTDQRGVSRPQGGGCDIGAVEVAGGPTTNAISYNAPENGTLTVDAGQGVLSVDSTPTNFPLQVNRTGYSCSGQECVYTSQDAPVFIKPDGSFSYTPPAGFTGPDSFTYEAIDPSTDLISARVTVTLNVEEMTSTSTHLAASPNPAKVGGAVTYTATVTPKPDGGTVQFTDAGKAIAGCTAAAVSTSTGKATCHAVYHATGSHTIKAVYAGNASFGRSQSSTVTEVVKKAATSIKVVSSANPSKVGKALMYIATVSPKPGGGTVKFTDGGHTISGCAAVAVSGSTGKATCQVTYHSPGTHRIQAVFSGHAAFLGSSSPVVTQEVKTR